MLEKRIVAPEHLFGEGYLNCGSSGMRTGQWVTPDGVFASNAGPTGREGKPGYAKAGAMRFSAVANYSVAVVSGWHTAISGYVPLYMATKLHFKSDESEKTVDTLVSGEQILCIKKGFVDTDQYASNFFPASVAIGAPLYITGGILSTGWVANQFLQNPRAIYWGTKNGPNASKFDSTYSTTGMIYVEILGQG